MNTGVFERFFRDLEDPRQSAKVVNLSNVPRAAKILKTLAICISRGSLTGACSIIVCWGVVDQITP